MNMRNYMIKLWDTVSRFGPVALFATAFVSLIYFQLFGSRGMFYHEAAYPLLYSKTNLETWLPFSSRFSGREVSPLSWPLVGSLWLLIFGKVSLAAHCATAVTFSIFFTGVAYLFARAVKFSYFGTFFFLTLIILNFCDIPTRYMWVDQVWTWPMNSYGVYDAFSLLSLTTFFLCIQRFISRDPSDARPSSTVFVFTCVWFFLTGLNGMRGFMVIAGPVFAGIVFELLLSWKPTQDRVRTIARVPEIKLIAILLIATAIGVVITLSLTQGVPQIWQDGHKLFTIKSAEELPERLSKLMVNWFIVFGGIPPAGIPVVSPIGILRIALSVFCIFILVLPFVRIGRLNSEEHFFEKIVIFRYFFILLLLLVSGLYATGSTAQRYLIPVGFAAFFAFSFAFDSWVKTKQYGKVVAVCLLLTPIYINTIWLLVTQSPNGYQDLKPYRLAQFLKEKRLTHGFAGPWSSDVLTVWHFSNGEVQPGLIDPETMGPHPHADKKWFDPATYSGRTFLALPAVMRDESPKALALASLSKKSFQFEDWVIDVFPKNIAKYLDRPIDATLCTKLPPIEETDETVNLAIAGEGHQVGCGGWGMTIQNGSKFVRPLIGNAQVYLAASKPRNQLTVHLAAFGKNDTERRMFDRISVNVNGAEVGSISPDGLQSDQVLRFKLPQPVEARKITTVEFRVPTGENAAAKNFLLVTDVNLE